MTLINCNNRVINDPHVTPYTAFAAVKHSTSSRITRQSIRKVKPFPVYKTTVVHCLIKRNLPLSVDCIYSSSSFSSKHRSSSWSQKHATAANQNSMLIGWLVVKQPRMAHFDWLVLRGVFQESYRYMGEI